MVQCLRLREATETTVILINCAPFQNRNFSLRKEFVTGGSDFFPLRGSFYGMDYYYGVRIDEK